jgi:hypothetical protein
MKYLSDLHPNSGFALIAFLFAKSIAQFVVWC